VLNEPSSELLSMWPIQALIGACSLQANHNPMDVIESRYIGIDVGKRRCQACVMHGSIDDEFIFESSFEGISCLVGKIKRN